MPWCEECEKSWTPTSVNTDGTCPKCGRSVEGGGHVGHSHEVHNRKAPWHFLLMVAVITVYLGYRLIQLILWLL